MSGFLLDTNVVSELVKVAPDEHVVAWVGDRSPLDLYLSSITLGELVRGVARLPEGRRHDGLACWIAEDLSQQFEGRMLAFDREAAVIWGHIMGRGDRSGRSRTAIDAQIASIALRHELALATRNEADFDGMGVEIVNPWGPA